MPASAFELIDKETFQIGERVVSCHFCDPPFDGKYRYLAETTSDKRDRIGQHLFIHDFRDVHPSDLPNGISINIHSPRSDFRQVNSVDIKKAGDQSELTIVLSFDYVDWYLPINLQHFVECYCEVLRSQVASLINCEIDHSEPGIFLSCSICVAPDLDYSTAYRNAIDQMVAAYRKSLADIYKSPLQQQAVSLPSDDTAGAKWWFRYVVVPILGSGAVAAIAASLIALVK